MLEGRNLITRTAALAGAGAAGGALALGGSSLAGGRTDTTTVREIQRIAVRSAAAVDTASPSIGLVYRRDAPGVVHVAGSATRGSGFVIDKAGHVLTSYRTVARARAALVSFSNDDRIRARVVGADPATGVAVLQLRTRSRALQPLPFGSSRSVGVGDPVLAIGNPDGYARTVTAGIVSGLVPRSRYTADELIRTDAALDRGSAGGPLLDELGRVIGLTAGDGIAIPIDAVKRAAADLIAGRTVERPSLGASVAAVDTELARRLNLPVTGLLVEHVQTGGPAARAGLRGGTTRVVVAGESYTLGGDLIVRAGGTRVATVAALGALLASKRPGDRLDLEIYRGASRMTLHSHLGRLPTVPG